MKAKEIMTGDVISVEEATPVREIGKILTEKRISGVPVLNKEGKLAGVVTEQDLLYKVARPYLPPHIELLGGIIFLEKPGEIDDELKKILGLTAKDVMTHKVVTVDEETDVEEVATLLVTRKINRVPVMKKDTLVGIITRADIIKAFVRQEE